MRWHSRSPLLLCRCLGPDRPQHRRRRPRRSRTRLTAIIRAWAPARSPRRSLERRAAGHAHRGKAVVPEHAKNLLGMAAVACLHGHVELGALGRHVEEQPVMIDTENIGAAFAEPAG